MSDTVKVETSCPRCKKHNTLEIDKSSYVAWRSGTFIQKAFPDLTAEQREWLMTGYDQKCWDEMFDLEED